MKNGLLYILTLLLLSCLIYFLVTNLLANSFPSITFLLSMLVSHFIIERNEWMMTYLAKAGKWALRQ
ncbi:hypothetical protein J2S77_002784 [Alkalibacillus salilacus]|uniref:Uncharacterized protein n=1 Tax=Alkalibacillus salilacus TaxID=284582 RepID=A0ABT9VIJ7_9BACI|nr:hypothetical protein [Alkalibacillus salilacus]